jgi:hypothetical protein
MTDKNFNEELNRLGFPLFTGRETVDADLVLAQMAQSQDPRLWEGFAVVLANGFERGLLDYPKVLDSLKDKKAKDDCRSLVLMSLALYRFLGLKFSWAGSLKDLLKGSKEFDLFLKKFKQNEDFDLAGKKMSPDRLKTVFSNYFSGRQGELNNMLNSKDEMGLEYALSQVFSPKQKELFFKKLKGERLTKTENEYYSRTVKKKVLALANAELHRMAKQLLS